MVWLWVNGPTYVPGEGIRPLQIASRKVHGTAGTFSVNLPVTGNYGIEPRRGGTSGKDFEVIATFPTPLVAWRVQAFQAEIIWRELINQSLPQVTVMALSLSACITLRTVSYSESTSLALMMGRMRLTSPFQWASCSAT